MLKIIFGNYMTGAIVAYSSIDSSYLVCYIAVLISKARTEKRTKIECSTFVRANKTEEVARAMVATARIDAE